jgi:hypothetical protein
MIAVAISGDCLPDIAAHRNRRKELEGGIPDLDEDGLGTPPASAADGKRQKFVLIDGAGAPTSTGGDTKVIGVA